MKERRKIDVATLFGIIGGLTLVFFAIIKRGQAIGTALPRGILGAFADPVSEVTSILITVGGTFAAVFVNYPIQTVGRMFKVMARALFSTEQDPTDVIEQLIKFSRIARKEGPLALERELKHVENKFLKRAIQLVVDGASSDRIRAELYTEINFMRERHRIGQEMFQMLGTYCPAFGMLGTIIGLIMLLGSVQNPSQVTAGMSVALLTTFWGVLMGYLIFLPIAGKLKRRSDEEAFINQIIIEGVLSIQAGENPMIMEGKLKAYLAPHLREILAKRKRIRVPLVK